MTGQEELLAARAIELRNYDEAIRLLRPLAERKSEYALLTLGWIHETGALGTTDVNSARSYYELAAYHGSASAHLYLGWLHLKAGNESEARRAFENGANLDIEECKSALARLADNAAEKRAGKAIEIGSFEEAVQLLRPLAERNSEYALLTLGWICEIGANGSPDHDAALSYYVRAVAQGSIAAYLELGRILLKRNEEVEARAAFKDGAQEGNIACMAELGRMMTEGRGGPIDCARGYVWLEKAASKGHIFAQRTLLTIEERNAKSLSEKLSVKKRIAALAAKGAKEMLRDPHSDKLR